MAYSVSHKNCIKQPTRTEALKIAQQRYRQTHREAINKKQREWYHNNTELFNTYRKKNKPTV